MTQNNVLLQSLSLYHSVAVFFWWIFGPVFAKLLQTHERSMQQNKRVHDKYSTYMYALFGMSVALFWYSCWCLLLVVYVWRSGHSLKLAI